MMVYAAEIEISISNLEIVAGRGATTGSNDNARTVAA